MAENNRDVAVTALLCDEGAATSIEYALVAGIFAIAVVFTVRLLGLSVQDLFVNVHQAFH